MQRLFSCSSGCRITHSKVKQLFSSACVTASVDVRWNFTLDALPYTHCESDQFKSPQFRGHPGQLNNSQPVITEPSPDGDFPFFRSCDYATQNPVEYHCGWNLYIEHLPFYFFFKALGQATFYSLNLSQGDSSFRCNSRVNCVTVALSSAA